MCITCPLKTVELSGAISKSDKNVAVSIAIQLFFSLKLIVLEKMFEREFDPIPGYILPKSGHRSNSRI